MSKIFTPNRIALITGILLAAAAFVATLQTSLVSGSPGAEAAAKAAGVIASIITVWRLLEKFLDGSQNWDSLMVAGVPKAGGVIAPGQVDELVEEDPELSGELTAEGMTMYEEQSEHIGMLEGGDLASPSAPPPGPRAVPPTLYDQEEEPPK